MSAVSLQRVKDHLNITVGTQDGELQGFLDAAESAIAKKVGPLAPTSTTERVRGGDSALVLRRPPVVSLTSVTPVGGTALTVADLVSGAGVVEYAEGGRFPARFYDVVYVAGRDPLPKHLELAVLELVRHLWTTQRGVTTRPGSRESESAANTLPGAGHALPFRVQELIADDVQVGL